MEFELDAGWSLQPAGGSTGSAFLGVYANQNISLNVTRHHFLRHFQLNTSPRGCYGRAGSVPAMC